MLDIIIKKIESLCGPICSDNYSYHNGKPSYLDSKKWFNYIFKPVSIEVYQKFVESSNFFIPDELMRLYTECNGVRLFLSSFSIYGIQSHTNEYEPYDLFIENYNNQEWTRKEKIFIFGAYGRDYVFAYRIDDYSRILCISVEEHTIVLEFKSLEELIDYFISKVSALYGKDCKKLIPNAEFEGMPYLENSAYKIEEIL